MSAKKKQGGCTWTFASPIPQAAVVARPSGQAGGLPFQVVGGAV